MFNKLDLISISIDTAKVTTVNRITSLHIGDGNVSYMIYYANV